MKKEKEVEFLLQNNKNCSINKVYYSRKFSIINKQKNIKNENVNNLKGLLLLLKCTTEKKLYFSIFTIFLIMSSCTLSFIPYFIGKIIDEINENGNKKIINKIGYEYLSLLITIYIVVFCRESFGCYIFQYSSYSLKTKLFSSLITNDIEFFDKKKTGELLNRLDSDVESIKYSASTCVNFIIKIFIQMCISYVIMFTISWKLSIVISTAIPIYLTIVIVYTKYLNGIAKKYQDILAESSVIAEEVFSNIRIIKSFSSEKKEKQFYASKVKEAYELGKIMGYLESFFTGLINLLVFGSMFLIIFIGGNMYIKGNMKIGELLSFNFYLIDLSGNIRHVGFSVSKLITSVGIASKLDELINYIPTIKYKKKNDEKPFFIGKIEFKEVTFSYASKSEINVIIF